MKRKRMTPRQKADRWDGRFLRDITTLNDDEQRWRVIHAYLDGYDAGRRDYREKLKRLKK